VRWERIKWIIKNIDKGFVTEKDLKDQKYLSYVKYMWDETYLNCENDVEMTERVLDREFL